MSTRKTSWSSQIWVGAFVYNRHVTYERLLSPSGLHIIFFSVVDEINMHKYIIVHGNHRHNSL